MSEAWNAAELQSCVHKIEEAQGRDGKRALQLEAFMLEVSEDSSLHHRALDGVAGTIARLETAHSELDMTYSELEVPCTCV